MSPLPKLDDAGKIAARIARLQARKAFFHGAYKFWVDDHKATDDAESYAFTMHYSHAIDRAERDLANQRGLLYQRGKHAARTTDDGR